MLTFRNKRPHKSGIWKSYLGKRSSQMHVLRVLRLHSDAPHVPMDAHFCKRLDEIALVLAERAPVFGFSETALK